MAEPATATPAPVREKGYALQSSDWWAMAINEPTPELRWPLSIRVYDNMRRQDAQVASVLRAVTSPVHRTQWRLDGTGCRPEVTAHVAEDMGLPVAGEGNEVPALRGRDRFSWQQHLRLALLMLPFGHMFFESVYRYDEQGLARLRKLGPRLPSTIADVKVAQDGGLQAIVQFSATMSSSDVTIPVSRLVAYVHDREGGNWLGSSLLRPAYKNWLIKDRLLRVQAQTIERNGMGIPTYTGAEDEDDLTKGQDIATSVRSGDNSGAAIPYGSKLDLKGVEGDLPDAEKPIRYHDEQIARAVLAHFLNLGTQTGSWALGSTFADFFTLSLQAVAQEVADTASLHIVQDLVELNYGVGEAAPRVIFDEIGSRRDATAEAIKVLVDAGALSTDEELEQFVRTSYGLPGKPKSPTEPAAPAEPTGTE